MFPDRLYFFVFSFQHFLQHRVQQVLNSLLLFFKFSIVTSYR